MDFTTRPIQEGDGELANKWLEGWRNRQPLPLTMYSRRGLVLESNGEPVFIAFVWWDETCKMMQIGFITRNPFFKKIPFDTRYSFLHDVRKYCADLGAKQLITWTNNDLLIQDFKRLGFHETSNSVSELIIYKLI